MNENEPSNVIKLKQFEEIMNEQKEIKTKADTDLSNKKYKDAEEKYNIILNNIGNLPNNTGDIDISQEQMNSMFSLLKAVYGNMSLAQAKQFKLTEAINTTTYILTKIDPYYDKGYIRIIKWLIQLEQFERAFEVEEQIKRVFNDTKQFEGVLSFLHRKKEEKERNKALYKEKNYNNNMILGGLGIGFAILLVGFIWKYYKR